MIAGSRGPGMRMPTRLMDRLPRCDTKMSRVSCVASRAKARRLRAGRTARLGCRQRSGRRESHRGFQGGDKREEDSRHGGSRAASRSKDAKTPRRSGAEAACDMFLGADWFRADGYRNSGPAAGVVHAVGGRAMSAFCASKRFALRGRNQQASQSAEAVRVCHTLG